MWGKLLCHQSTYLEKFPEPVCDRERIQEKDVIVPTQPSPLVEFPVLHFSRKKRPRQDRYKYDVAQEDLNFCNQVLSHYFKVQSAYFHFRGCVKRKLWPHGVRRGWINATSQEEFCTTGYATKPTKSPPTHYISEASPVCEDP